jgi:glycosyltransferase involved in cell wall biosynthesis
MRIAIVHDWLVTMRGGENVVEALCEAFPSADVYTIFCQKEKISPSIRDKRITASFIQRLPFSKGHFRCYLPLFPLAVERFDLSGYDLVISTSHCVAKGVRPPPGAYHLCYCHSPMRYVWDFQDEYFGALKSNWATGPAVRAMIAYLKDWDVKASARVDRFVANSRHIAGKIKEYYHRDAAVIYPPVDTDFFDFGPAVAVGDYFLIVASLVPYKKVDMAIGAFNRTGDKLKIVGDGPLLNSLRHKAGTNIEFLGKVDRQRLKGLYQACRALVFNQQEDFGIAAGRSWRWPGGEH